MPAPGLGTVPGLCPCTDCGGGCSWYWRQFIVIVIPASIVAWVNGILVGTDSCDPTVNPMPVPDTAEWEATVRAASDLLEPLDFASPPVAWGANLNTFEGVPVCPSEQVLQYTPFADTGEAFHSEWCPGTGCGDFIPGGDFFQIPEFTPEGFGGPQAGVTIYMPALGKAFAQGCLALTLLPYVTASKIEVTGLPQLCASLRQYDNAYDNIVVNSCSLYPAGPAGSSEWAAGKMEFPHNPDEYPLGVDYPPYAGGVNSHSLEYCLWFFHACYDCPCP